MSIVKIEKELLKQLKELKGKSFKMSQVMEWSTSEEAVDKNLKSGEEEKVFVKDLGIWCAVLIDKTKAAKTTFTFADLLKITEKWGKDHWSLLAYFETRCVDFSGSIEFVRMRINPKFHPVRSGDWHSSYGTRLNDGSIPNSNHDDYDVMEELEKYNFIQNIGSGINPVIKLTKIGKKTVDALRSHKASNKNYNTFKMLEHVKM